MTLLGVDRAGLRKGATGQTVKIYALNAPASVQASDLDLGPGVSVTGATVANNVITATVSVADAAVVGPRDIVISGAVKPGSAGGLRQGGPHPRDTRVEPGPDRWRELPEDVRPVRCVGVHERAGQEAQYADDVKIDVVDATWSMEEYTATLDDDDIKFVGAVDAKSGTFTPAIEGPNELRSGQRNNIGDVWVVATYTEGGSPLRGRAHLLVSPPVYMRFDSSVISR